MGVAGDGGGEGDGVTVGVGVDADVCNGVGVDVNEGVGAGEGVGVGVEVGFGVKVGVGEGVEAGSGISPFVVLLALLNSGREDCIIAGLITLTKHTVITTKLPIPFQLHSSFIPFFPQSYRSNPVVFPVSPCSSLTLQNKF